MASLHYLIPSTTSTLSLGYNSSSSSFFISRMRLVAPVRFEQMSLTKKKRTSSLTVVAAVGDVTSDGNNYLIAGAIGVALLGTAFPIFFSRKDT